jgi:hypothetical protein
MATQHFKLFEFERQMLVTKSLSDDDDYQISFEIKGDNDESISMHLGYADKELRNDAFENELTDEVARSMFDNLIEYLP